MPLRVVKYDEPITQTQWQKVTQVSICAAWQHLLKALALKILGRTSLQDKEPRFDSAPKDHLCPLRRTFGDRALQ